MRAIPLIYIYGEQGCGKTTLANALAKDYLERCGSSLPIWDSEQDKPPYGLEHGILVRHVKHAPLTMTVLKGQFYGYKW